MINDPRSFDFKVEPNDPERAGSGASLSTAFGPHARYLVFAIHTRFDAVSWIVRDYGAALEGGLPAVIRQAATLDEALVGLELGS